MLEIPPLMWSSPSRLITAFGLPSLQPPTPSLCSVRRGGLSLTLSRDMTNLVYIKLGKPSPYKSGFVRLS